jgi:beta-N-acetylhexosaminidase
MKKVNSWKELTLREKIGQTVICLCETEKHVQMCGSIQKFAEKYPIGGIFNNVGLVKGLLTGANHEFSDIIAEYNKYLRVPLIGTADHGFFATENGVELPPQMALGAANDASIAYKTGEFKAEDYKKSGVHWGFWPVCDLALSSNVRAVSDDPQRVIDVCKEQVQAMKDHGVIACIKHYPSRAVATSVDSHLAPSDNESPIELWRNTCGKIYKALFEAGVPTVMTGHSNLVEYQTEKINGVYPPATMSYELTTKLLREELGFRGVTVTDALVMGGFGGIEALENTVRSFLAGNDMLLWPAYEYIDEMERRILSGEIDEKILDSAVERIWNLKKEYGILDGKTVSSDKDVEYFENIAVEGCEKCLTLRNNYNGLLPLDRDKVKNVFVVGVTPNDEQYEAICRLKPELEKYGCNVTVQRNIWTEQAQKVCRENDLVIYALCRTFHYPVGPLDFWGEDALSIWASNCSDKNKTLVVSFGVPTMYKYYRLSGTTYVNAYNFGKDMVHAFVRAIFGEIEFLGDARLKDVD